MAGFGPCVVECLFIIRQFTVFLDCCCHLFAAFCTSISFALLWMELLVSLCIVCGDCSSVNSGPRQAAQWQSPASQLDSHSRALSTVSLHVSAMFIGNWIAKPEIAPHKRKSAAMEFVIEEPLVSRASPDVAASNSDWNNRLMQLEL